jgi:ppGpp synthetase/RelA/SpoT-type nucleotidyltranferase
LNDPRQIGHDAKTRLRLDHPDVTLRLLLSGADQIAQRLRTLSATIGPTSRSTQFYTRVRAKSSDSIREKVSRKQREPDARRRNPNYSFRQLTDAIGLRVVTLYDKELITATNYILDLIRAGQQLPDPLFDRRFVWGLFREALFIKRRSDHDNDPYALCLAHVKSLVTSDCRESLTECEAIKTFVLNNCRDETRDDNRYSSAHIIFDALAHVGNYEIEIPVEFQLRTAVEDVWAEINHKFVYKTNTSRVWSDQYQAAYDRSKKVSIKLKDLIDELPDVIDDFYQNSKAASGAVEAFWQDDPAHGFQFSLCISLFFAMGDRHGERYALLFEDYRKLIEQVKEAHRKGDKEAPRQLLMESLHILEKVSGRIREEQARPNYAQVASEIQQQIDRERISLCDLEVLRLKAFLITNYNCWVSDQFEVYLLRTHGPVDRQRFLMDLYSKFCEYLDRPLQLRPVCMIMFFKHLISTGLNSPLGNSLAAKNLADSYEFLDLDKTIPQWSIYRVLLPRHLAMYRLLEAKAMLDQIADRKELFDGMITLRSDLQAKLVEALSYALRATREHFEGLSDKGVSDKRGDILFGFEPNEQIHDLTIVIDVCWLYMEYFDNIGGRLLPVVKAEVCEDLQNFLHLTQETKDDETIGRLREKAADVIEILCAEARMKGQANAVMVAS